jgi:hypothetical protein
LRGIVYSATGERYVAEALESAHASLRHNDVPHVVYASPVPEGADRIDPRLTIEAFEPSGEPYLDKIANMGRSPFERTIFLDTDIYVAGDITHILDALDHYDVAAAHAPGYRGFDDPSVPAAFYELNTGVVAWRSSEQTARFFEDWRDTYRAWLADEPFPNAASAGDQPPFRHCLWTNGLRVLVLAPEYNARITKPLTVVDRVRVLHGRHPDHARLAARLNRRMGPRNIRPDLRTVTAALGQGHLVRPKAFGGHGDPLVVLRAIGRNLLRR